MRIYHTKHFPFNEFVVSKTHPELAASIQLTDTDKFKIYVLSNILELIRTKCDNTPILVLSGKRSEELNIAIGGAKNSDHLFRYNSAAVDFTFKSKPDYYLWNAYLFIHMYFEYSYGQLILYFNGGDINKPTFIHLSLPTSKHKSERRLFFNGEYVSLKKGINKYPDLKQYLT